MLAKSGPQSTRSALLKHDYSIFLLGGEDLMSIPARASRFTLKGILNRQSLASTALAEDGEDPSEKSACIPKAGAAEEKTRARPTQRVCVL